MTNLTVRMDNLTLQLATLVNITDTATITINNDDYICLYYGLTILQATEAETTTGQFHG